MIHCMQVCGWATHNGIDPAPFKWHMVDGRTLLELEVPEMVQLGIVKEPIDLRNLLVGLRRWKLKLRARALTTNRLVMSTALITGPTELRLHVAAARYTMVIHPLHIPTALSMGLIGKAAWEQLAGAVCP